MQQLRAKRVSNRKNTMKHLFILLFCGLLVSGFAQKKGADEFEGCWRGVITQDQGGYRPEYGMELFIKQDGNKITGRSFVYFDKVYAEMEFEGLIIGSKILQIKETKISAMKRVEGMEWCLKNAMLTISKTRDPWRLEGAWNGSTIFGPCIPGKIILVKSIPRA